MCGSGVVWRVEVRLEEAEAKAALGAWVCADNSKLPVFVWQTAGFDKIKLSFLPALLVDVFEEDRLYPLPDPFYGIWGFGRKDRHPWDFAVLAAVVSDLQPFAAPFIRKSAGSEMEQYCGYHSLPLYDSSNPGGNFWDPDEIFFRNE